MIILYQFAPAFGIPNPSTFCAKVETYLRMVNLPYELNNQGDLGKAPKEKMPYIIDEGQTIADSSIILNYLNQKYQCDLDIDLSPQQKAQSLAMKLLMEEHLYWAVVYSHWIDEAGWPEIKQVFFGSLPPVVRSIVPRIAKQKITKQLYEQGMGRHSREEIYDFAAKDIEAIAIFLGDKPYFMGEQPTSLDATAFGMLCNLVWLPFESPLRDSAMKYDNLSLYCERMRSRYFPELKPQ